MTYLKNYLEDGANFQARATLMALQGRGPIDRESDSPVKIEVARWENCREQGYVVMFRNSKREQMNIAFFEHRNSDSIHAVKWIQNTINSPTIDTAEFGDVYQNKYNTSHSVSPYQYQEMADWIFEQFEQHFKV